VLSALSQFRDRYLVRFWAPLPALVALGIASAYYFAITGTFWAVTGEFTRWGGHVLSWFGYQPQEWSYFKLIGLGGTPLDRIDGVMIIGMFIGALCTALWAGNVGLRWPTSKRRLAQGLIGGIIAGFGARLAMGCNLAAFFTGIPMFSLHAWAFMLATVGGAWVGVKICLLPFLRIPLKVGAQSGSLFPDPAQLKRRASVQSRLGVAVLLAGLVFVAWRFSVSLALGMACVFGVLFGGLIERAQVCFTSAARDLWTTGRTQVAQGILLGMLVCRHWPGCLAENLLDGPQRHHRRSAVRDRHRARRRLRNRLDVPGDGRAGAFLGGRGGQRHRRHLGSGVLGRTGQRAGPAVPENQSAGALRPWQRPVADLRRSGPVHAAGAAQCATFSH
jgi:hypothetical protein